MHSSEGSLFLIERNISLNHPGGQILQEKFLLAPRPGEETTLILSFLEFHDIGPFEPRLGKNHLTSNGVRPTAILRVGGTSTTQMR
jgi:hypothetical protein